MHMVQYGCCQWISTWPNVEGAIDDRKSHRPSWCLTETRAYSRARIYYGWHNWREWLSCQSSAAETAIYRGWLPTSRNASLPSLYTDYSAIDHPGALVCTRRDRCRYRQHLHAGVKTAWTTR